MQAWEVTQNFIDTCNENISLIAEAYKDKKPVKLKSFHNFDKFEDYWWDEFYTNFDRAYTSKQRGHYQDVTGGRVKWNYAQNNTLPILDALSTHLFSKVYSNHKVVCWMTWDEEDYGTDWHEDWTNESPTYLICMNLIGNTRWQFDGYDDIYLKPGDVIAQNGSVKHKVTPIDNQKRITLAGHRGLSKIIL